MQPVSAKIIYFYRSFWWGDLSGSVRAGARLAETVRLCQEMWQSRHSSHWPSIPYNSSMNVGETWDLLRCPKKKRKMSKVSVLNIYAKIFLKLPETIDYVSFFFNPGHLVNVFTLLFDLRGNRSLAAKRSIMFTGKLLYLCSEQTVRGFRSFFAEKNASSCEENGSEENNKSETKQHTCEGSV